MERTVYIVTDAAGHLGSHVTDALLKQGNEVLAFLRRGEQMPVFVSVNPQQLQAYFGDVRDRASLDALFENAEDASFMFIHCAGIISISEKKDPRIYGVNVNGTGNVVDACRAHGVKRLVYVSSVHAIPLLPEGQTMGEISSFCPDCVHGQYAKTKAAATQLVLDAAKDALGIESPSKRFRDEVGVYMAQGIGVGFEKEMPAIAKRIEKAIPTEFDIGTKVNVGSNAVYDTRGNRRAYGSGALAGGFTVIQNRLQFRPRIGVVFRQFAGN